MAIKTFITLENLTLYDSLIKQVISEGDAKAIKAAALNNNKLELYTIENPTPLDTPRFSITLPYVEKEVQGTNGKALIFNESDGGGAKFEHKDGVNSFVGVNDGGEGGLAAQIYAVKQIDGKYVGTRINVTNTGIYYTNGNNSAAVTPGDELATKKDVQGDAASKTVYVVESTGGSSDPFSKKYDLYQGSQGSPVSPVPAEKLTSISIPKDMFIESGSVKVVTVPDEPYEGAEPGDYYIDLVLANAESDHIYIPANSLVDVYTAAQGATEVQLAIDNNNVISASIVAVNGSKIVNGSILKAKLETNVQNSLNLADSALQNEDIGSVDNEDIEALFE